MSPLPHEFGDASLLELALTHSSATEGGDNERLEFLGDAVLDLIVAEELYRRHPDLAEGILTELKAFVVSRRTLAEAAERLGFEQEIRVGPGLRRRALPRSLLANVYEAILGAVYLDAGLEASRAFVFATLSGEIESAGEQRLQANPKQELQQHCQREWGAPPSYVLLVERGQAHSRAFLVAAETERERFPSAWGRTMKEAERWAAHEALLALSERDEP